MKKTSFKNRIIWIILVMFVWYILIGSVVIGVPIMTAFDSIDCSPSMEFILTFYMSVISDIIAIVLLLSLFRKNRPILGSFRISRSNCLSCDAARADLVSEAEAAAEYLPDQLITYNNTWRLLGLGLLLGFLTNFACILCSMLHGDVKFVSDFTAKGIPLMLFALLAVFVQSTAEELWCRGFMYERINVHYPLWVAILANGILFGLLHVFNDGVTVLAIADIIICGLSYSLLRWYTGSIWTCMGIHTAWNFTQNFLFGLPNSGLVSETSVFTLDAVNGTSNLIYDYAFGVEGALPAVLVDLLLGVVIILLAKRDGRLGELLQNKERLYDEGYRQAVM